MPSIKIYDTSKQEVGTLNLNDEIFAVPYNEALIHEVVVAHLANNRQVTQRNLGDKKELVMLDMVLQKLHNGQAVV